MPLVKDFGHYCREQLAALQPELLRELMLQLTEVFLFNQRYRVELIDTGYDLSDMPVAENSGYQLSDYATVADFLKEASGQRLPSYTSGQGLLAETHADWLAAALEERVHLELTALTRQWLKLGEFEDLPWDCFEPAGQGPRPGQELEDIVFLTQLEFVEQSLAELQAVNMHWMVKTFEREISQRQAEREMARQAAHQQRQTEDRIARHIDKQAQFLLAEPKYTREQWPQLSSALQTLQALVPATDFILYLKSDYFRNKVSLSVYRQFLQQDFRLQE